MHSFHAATMLQMEVRGEQGELWGRQRELIGIRVNVCIGVGNARVNVSVLVCTLVLYCIGGKGRVNEDLQIKMLSLSPKEVRSCQFTPE